MKATRFALVAAFLAAVFAAPTAGAAPQAQPPRDGAASTPAPPPPPPAAPAAAPAAGPSANAAVEEVIKLYNAKFSEEFIRRKIKTDGTVFNLSVGDLVHLKEAGIPESLVDAMLATGKPSTEGAAPRVAPAGAPAGSPQAAAPAGPKAWDGLVRRSSGSVVGIGYRWEYGALRLEADQLKWTDSENVERNLLVAVKAMKEHFLTCEKRPGGDCFEWGFRTKDGEYRFRDLTWKMGPSQKATDIYDFVKAAYPNLAAPHYPVDERK